MRPRQVVGALLAQGVLAALCLWVEAVPAVVLGASAAVDALTAATLAGTSFVFGYVGGARAPLETVTGGSTFVFGFPALPMVMVVSALAMLLSQRRILPLVVHAASRLLRRTLHIGGALGVCAAAKVFLGPTEAPLLIRPYLGKLTRSELFTVMTLGMATTSAAVMVIYATILESVVAHPIGHVLTASLIGLPGSVAVSRLTVPHRGPDTDGSLAAPYRFGGAMDAVSEGATDGLKLFLNIIAMLIVTLALASPCNIVLGPMPLSFAI